MSEGNQKINAFQISVKREVEDEINALIHRAEQESDELISEVKDEGLNFSFAKISAETKAIKTACKKKVSKQSFEMRRAILARRNELVDEFFASIEKELIDFAKSNDYKSFIEKSITEITEKLPFYDGVQIFVKPGDLKTPELFGKHSVSLTADKRIKIGGVAVFYPNEKVYIDRTLDKRLANERMGFTNHKEIQL